MAVNDPKWFEGQAINVKTTGETADPKWFEGQIYDTVEYEAPGEPGGNIIPLIMFYRRSVGG